MSINKVILVGNVGKDPEVRYLDNGVAVANFPLATSETYTAKSGEKVTNTEWHNIVAWRGLAEVAEKYIKKGKQLYIEGKIKTRSYEDKEGVKKYMTEIYADSMQMLGRKEDDDNNSSNNYQKPENQKETNQVSDFDSNDSGDDLPF
ncbi:MAG: single-stranded DNA-binding protein [Prolixibacteraceae bacterium]|jgi:single-strand DNA-binding protein|nr:single-stranded DNA-binding protein [Prolixibacteraceae bacterium]